METQFDYHDALKRGAREYEEAGATKDHTLRQQKLALAKGIAEKLVSEDPNDPLAMGLLGACHFANKDYGSALACHATSVQNMQKMGRESSESWYNLASVFSRTYHFPSSEVCFQKSVELNPNSSDAWGNYSGLMLAYGQSERAEEYARKAVELNNDNALAHMHLGFALLMQNRWEEGWAELEWRKKRRENWPRAPYPLLDWNGEPADCVVIHGEQGLGDELFNCSLVRRVQEIVPRVVVECSSRLVPLLRRSLTCEVYGSMEDCVRNGVFSQDVLDEQTSGQRPGLETLNARPRLVAMGTLPHILKATRENTSDSHYLRADPFRKAWYRAQLQTLAKGRPIVGVAWVGGDYDTHKKLRNPPRELFTRLDPEKYCLVSVQYTQGAREQAARMGMVHFQAAIDDLDEQAALISALDVMVSVAQTAMHIAGGLDVPTLALIHQYPKWDMGQNGDPSIPWWQSVRAIRQENDDWDAVFDKLLSELGEGTEEEVRTRRLKAIAEYQSRKAEKFGALPDFSQIHIGDTDASQTSVRAAE